MINEPIKLLMVEDNPGDARLIMELLKDAGVGLVDMVHEERLSDGLQRLSEESYDVLLLDLMLPDSHGLDTYVAAQQDAPDIPIVMLTSIDDEEFAFEAMRYGAQDYLVKGQIDSQLLIRALRYAIARTSAEQEIHRRTSQQEAINAIIAAGATSDEVSELIKKALEHLLSAVGQKRGGIWLVKGEFAIHGFPKDTNSVIFKVLEEVHLKFADPITVDDWGVIGENPLAILAPVMDRSGIRSSLAVPVVGEKEAIGIVIIASTTPHRWSEEEITLIEAAGQQLGVAVNRLDLQEITREQKAQLQDVLDTITDGILTMDSGGRILLANPTARQYLDVLATIEEDDTMSHLGGRPIEEFLFQREDGLPFEITSEGPPGMIFEVYVNPQDLTSGRGGWTLLIRDVTETRLAQNRVLLQERLAAVGQLAAGIAHDFNNILGTIVLFSQLLIKARNLDPTDHERLEVISDQARRAAYLISQILDFSRRSIMETHPMDLAAFLKELEKLLSRTLPETINILVSAEESVFAVNADRTRMQQLFMNLALNARDAMPEGGELRFELSRFQVKPGETTPFRDIPPGHWIKIGVSDTGIGISPDILPHIFEPFFTAKEPGKGTGLGLAQVYGIVKQHEGYIDVRSQEGAGSTFIVYLPAVEEQVDLTSIPDVALAVVGQGETILVVEDDGGTREAVGEVLESLEYRFLLAADGHEALNILKEHAQDVDLVLTDLVMPAMSGMELYKTLQEINPDLPFVFMTGYPLDPEMRKWLMDKRITLLQKPLTLENIAQTLDKALDRQN